MMALNERRGGRRAGFTLVELIVASTLMTIVLAGVYTTFSTSVRAWRSGESNYQTYEDARRAFGILIRELHAIPPNAMHLVNGSEDWIEFLTVSQPMNVESAASERLMQVRYSLLSGKRGELMTLQREEAIVKGPLPSAQGMEDLGGQLAIELGRPYEFSLASGVEGLSFYYTWAFAEPRPREIPPNWAEVVGDSVVEAALPQGIEISLVLQDPGNASSDFESTFTDVVTFRSATSRIPEYLVEPMLN